MLGPGRYSGLFSATPADFTAVSLQTNVTPAPTSSIRYRREHEIFFALMLAVVLISDSAYSATGTPGGFEQPKADQLKRLDSRIKQIEDEKTCIAQGSLKNVSGAS